MTLQVQAQGGKATIGSSTREGRGRGGARERWKGAVRSEGDGKAGRHAEMERHETKVSAVSSHCDVVKRSEWVGMRRRYIHGERD